MESFIPSALRRHRNKRQLTLEDVSEISGMSAQHLSEIESSKRDPRLSSIERIADAMGLTLVLVPDEIAPDVRKFVATNGRIFIDASPLRLTLHKDSQ